MPLLHVLVVAGRSPLVVTKHVLRERVYVAVGEGSRAPLAQFGVDGLSQAEGVAFVPDSVVAVALNDEPLVLLRNGVRTVLVVAARDARAHEHIGVHHRPLAGEGIEQPGKELRGAAVDEPDPLVVGYDVARAVPEKGLDHELTGLGDDDRVSNDGHVLRGQFLEEDDVVVSDAIGAVVGRQGQVHDRAVLGPESVVDHIAGLGSADGAATDVADRKVGGVADVVEPVVAGQVRKQIKAMVQLWAIIRQVDHFLWEWSGTQCVLILSHLSIKVKPKIGVCAQKRQNFGLNTYVKSLIK